MQEHSYCPQSRVDLKVAVQTVNYGTRSHPASVVTCGDFSAAPDAVWEALMFYEDVTRPAPVFLRGILPTPLGSEGCKSEVGGEVRCRYVTGHLLKRVTHIIRGRSYSFEIIEQNLSLRGGIKVLGGNYVLHRLSQNWTRVALLTRYESPNQPRWLFGRLEAVVCHLFHRHILTAIRNNVRRNVPTRDE